MGCGTATMPLPEDAYYARNLSYGMMDSLISTTGVLAGLAFAGMDRKAIILTGVILVFVEATSMAFGAAISDEHFELTAAKLTPERKWRSAMVMLLAYALTGAALVLPYVFVKDARVATGVSSALAISAMFVLVKKYQGTGKAGQATAVGTLILALSVAVGHYLPK